VEAHRAAHYFFRKPAQLCGNRRGVGRYTLKDYSAAMGRPAWAGTFRRRGSMEMLLCRTARMIPLAFLTPN
jgi:hypothetical protein